MDNAVICQKCKFHKFETDPESADTNGIVFEGTEEEKKKFLQTIWYNQFCTCSEVLNVEDDPVTGEMKMTYRNCRDINKSGKCSFFRKKI